jgi:hypothetical protein
MEAVMENWQRPQTDITILGWLYLIGHATFMALGAFIFILLTGIGAASGDAQARSVLTVVGAAIGVLLMLIGLPGLAAGYGLLTRKSWGRVLAIVIAILNLPNVPFGTLIGIYALWVLLPRKSQDSGAAWPDGEARQSL